MQYIRKVEDFESTKLLQFLMGSNIIIIKNIEVSFSPMKGSARQPISRTCLPMLALPNSYRNFCELWEEFTNILNARNCPYMCLNVGIAKLIAKLLWTLRKVYNYIECWEYWNWFHLEIIEIGLNLKKRKRKSFISAICMCLLYCLLSMLLFVSATRRSRDIKISLRMSVPDQKSLI